MWWYVWGIGVAVIAYFGFGADRFGEWLMGMAIYVAIGAYFLMMDGSARAKANAIEAQREVARLKEENEKLKKRDSSLNEGGFGVVHELDE